MSSSSVRVTIRNSRVGNFRVRVRVRCFAITGRHAEVLRVLIGLRLGLGLGLGKCVIGVKVRVRIATWLPHGVSRL